jgi:hypothetical protein
MKWRVNSGAVTAGSGAARQSIRRSSAGSRRAHRRHRLRGTDGQPVAACEVDRVSAMKKIRREAARATRFPTS